MTSKASGHNSVRKVYLDVIDDVISNVSEMFADEGVDENVLQELRTLWNKKLKESKALESPPEDRRMPGDDKGKNYIYLIPGSGQNGSQGQQGQKIYTTGNPQQRIIRSTNQQPIQRIVPPGTRLVASNQVGGSSGRPQGQQIVYRAQPSGDRSQVRGPGGPTRVILSRPASSQQISNARPINRVIQNVQPSQQTIVRQQPTHTVIQRSQPIQQTKLDNSQYDGPNPDEDEDSEMDSDSEDEESDHEGQNHQGQTDEEPLGSDDDINEGSDGEIFETDNVVICQFDKIQRVRNKWRFNLKDGIMNLNGKDYVFQRASGESDW